MNRPDDLRPVSKEQPLSTGHDESLQSGLALLARAQQYAQDTGTDIWTFAVEIEELWQAGLTKSDFRWLLARGYVEHARETTLPGAEERSFRPVGKQILASGVCFVLTPHGHDAVRGRNGESNGKPVHHLDNPEPNHVGPIENGATNCLKPNWDGERKQFRLGHKVIKRYRWPAFNQEIILAVFEEDGWPPRIDDPLPSAPETDPKRRLHDTIKCVNRNQENKLVRFRGDGTGEGVVWEFVPLEEQ